MELNINNELVAAALNNNDNNNSNSSGDDDEDIDHEFLKSISNYHYESVGDYFLRLGRCDLHA